MDKLVELLIETINSIFGEDKFSLIFYLGLILITILLFKEFKNKISNEINIKNEQLDMALKSLLKLKFEFIEYKGSSKSEENFGELKNNIIDAFPYVSYKLSKELHSITSNIDDIKINELISFLDIELEGLKYNQDSSIVMINNSNILDEVSYTLRARFYTIFMASTMTFISIIFILVITLFSVALSSVESGWSKYFFIQMIFNLVFFLFYVLLVGSLIQEKKLKNNLWSWGYVILTIIISIVLISLYRYGIWISIVHFALFFVMILMLKKFQNSSN